jgi:hypothetical protein
MIWMLTDTPVTYDTINVDEKVQNDLFNIWTKPKDHIIEIKNPWTKFKSDKNIRAKYDFSQKKRSAPKSSG